MSQMKSIKVMKRTKKIQKDRVRRVIITQKKV